MKHTYYFLILAAALLVSCGGAKSKKQEAKAVFYKYLPFIRLGSIPGGMAMAVHKEVLMRGGIIATNKVRSPFLQADETLIELVMDALDGLDLLALENGR